MNKIVEIIKSKSNLLDGVKTKKLPSENTLEDWYVYHSSKDYPKHTINGGKWLIFCNEYTINKTWDLIKIAQDNGLLGNVCKTSTKKNSSKNNNSFVICIYTYDFNDKDDILRVRENLKLLGFNNVLKYKRDIETKKGIYGSKNENLISI